jgi:hypothetical protein
VVVGIVLERIQFIAFEKLIFFASQVRKINMSSKPAVDISDAGDPVLSRALARRRRQQKSACVLPELI